MGDRYLVEDDKGQLARHNGFRRCEKISQRVGTALVSIMPIIGDVRGKSVWWWRRHVGAIERLKIDWSRIESDPNLFCFGAFEGDALVATCTLAVVPNLTQGCRPFGVIENVVTRPDRRRRGYGRAVLRHALAHAWDRGCYKVMLMTGRRNEATYRFYESAGFDRHAKQAFVAVRVGDA